MPEDKGQFDVAYVAHLARLQLTDAGELFRQWYNSRPVTDGTPQAFRSGGAESVTIP